MNALALWFALVFGAWLPDQGLRARVVVETSGAESLYVVDFKPGALRVEPGGASVVFLVDFDSSTVTLLDTEAKFLCRLEPQRLRRLAGMVPPAWFPWAYGVSADLVEDLTIETEGEVQLPNGREGLKVSVHSRRYDRVVAQYWIDPTLEGEFFQSREHYLRFWGTDDASAEEAQKARLAVYEKLPGIPVKMEERFEYLSRPRTVRIDDIEESPTDAFSLPETFRRLSESELYWDSILSRLREWLRLEQR